MRDWDVLGIGICLSLVVFGWVVWTR